MLGWIRKKTDAAAPTAVAPARTTRTPAGAKAASPAATPSAKDSPELLAQWRARLDAAAGDDTALLEVARHAPTVALKSAAVEAIVDEAALKQAEREFREHDRRVHRIAKQRHDAAVAQRVARHKAAGLLDTAAALLHEPTIPTNRLVDLDKAWQALGPTLLDDAQRERFAELSARLTALTGEKAERELQVQRWTAAAKQALATLNSASASASAGAGAGTGAGAGPNANASTNTSTSANAGAAADADATEPANPADAAKPPAADVLADAVAQAQASAADAPPGAAPEALAALLHEAVEKALTQAELAVQAEAKRGAQREAQRLLPSEPEATPAPPARPDAATRQARDARRQERLQAVAPLLQQAEEALAGGNLAGAHRHLADIDSGLAGASLPEALRTRLNAVHAEVARLKGWQSWGGGRARDDLVQEAQTLATATTAALADPQQAAKLPVKQLADAIDDLRKRWKELDRLGGATNQALWHAFDAALKTCFEPVGAHLDQLKARRKENLAARHQLLDALDAAAAGGQAAPVSVGTVGAVASAIPAPPAAPAAPAIPATPAIPVDRLAAPLVNPHPDAASNVVSNGTPSPSVDWRERARALMHFQTEWRKLGPVEHTVPHKARDALVARMQASVARIESPLQQARQSAQQTREQLVARAVALREEAAGQKHGRDIVARVRELQEQWQQHARSLPLARQAENALWVEFKTATDAVFAQRDAAFGARDAELLANQAAREALIRRLEALTEQTPAAEFKRTLAEVDAEWLQPVDVPRQQVAPLDARFRNARQAAQQVLAGSAQRVRQARFEALQHKLDLCEQLEARLDMRSDARLEMQLEARLDTQLDAQLDAQLEKQSDARSENSAADNPPTTAEWAARWAAAPSLQPAWEQALAARWQQAVDKAGATRPANASSALEALLLQLEAALGLASPADVQAARRDMKLRAMKAALEGRSAKQPPPPSIDALTHAALRHAHPDPTQRDRLHAILAALRSHEISPP